MRGDVIKEGVRQRRPSLIAKTRTDKGSQPGRTRKKVLREHQHLVLMCMVEQIRSEVRETEVGKDVKADGAGHHHTGQTIGLTSRLKSWHSSYAIIHTRLMCRCEEAAALQVQVEDATHAICAFPREAGFDIRTSIANNAEPFARFGINVADADVVGR